MSAKPLDLVRVDAVRHVLLGHGRFQQDDQLVAERPPLGTSTLADLVAQGDGKADGRLSAVACSCRLHKI
jgi:hypothetical protein